MSEPINESIQRDIEHVADLLREANDVLFITGAGVSADSGLPTYRGTAGLYTNGFTEEGMPIEEVLSGQMFERRPDLVWKYLLEVGRSAYEAKPNRAHDVIAAMEERFNRVCVFTQNIDDLHNQAGSTRVLEIHGNMRRLYCTNCGHGEELDAERFADHKDDASLPPRCHECEGVMRPTVVLFNEMLPVQVLREFEAEQARGFDVVFSVGTTSVFPYIAAPVMLASSRGIPTVEINPSKTEVSQFARIRIPLGAAQAMDAIWTALENNE